MKENSKNNDKKNRRNRLRSIISNSLSAIDKSKLIDNYQLVSIFLTTLIWMNFYTCSVSRVLVWGRRIRYVYFRFYPMKVNCVDIQTDGKKTRFWILSNILEIWCVVTGFIYEWKIKRERNLAHYKKIISYLISSQLDQICGMKIDTFWRIIHIKDLWQNLL